MRNLAAYVIAGAAGAFAVQGAWSWAIGTVALAVLAYMVARDAVRRNGPAQEPVRVEERTSLRAWWWF